MQCGIESNRIRIEVSDRVSIVFLALDCSEVISVRECFTQLGCRKYTSFMHRRIDVKRVSYL